MKRVTSAVILPKEISSNPLSISITLTSRCKSFSLRRSASGAVHAIKASRDEASSAAALINSRLTGSPDRPRLSKAESRSAERICAFASSSSSARASWSLSIFDTCCSVEAAADFESKSARHHRICEKHIANRSAGDITLRTELGGNA